MVPMLVLLGCNLQNSMLYYPSPYLPSEDALRAEGMQFWPNAAQDYRGFIGTAPIAKPKGTIVVFHGNAGTAAGRGHYVNVLTNLGYRVILAEYPGYGGRKGKLGEKEFVNDAKETLQLVSEQFNGPVFVSGESLGCGVVAAAVAKDSRVKINGIILITPWDTLLAVAKEKFRWFPVRLFLTDKYDTVGNLKTFQGKIAIVGAEQDEIIPIQHAQALYQSISVGKKIWIIKGAGHNDWPGIMNPLWWREIMDFVEGKSNK